MNALRIDARATVLCGSAGANGARVLHAFFTSRAARTLRAVRTHSAARVMRMHALASAMASRLRHACVTLASRLARA
jgi:hypothetical protein